MAIALMLSDPAAAELRGTPEAAPVFTAAEAAVIARNAALSALIQDNPRVVRQLLDALAAVKPDTPADGETRRTDDKRSPGGGSEILDPRANPDIDRLQRSSPEAVLDLFQLLKQAGARKTQGPSK
jgi:hypothetical protein